MAKKIRLTLNDHEYRIVINAINDMRNRLIQEGRYTDAVDELLLKVVNAPTKKSRFKEA